MHLLRRFLVSLGICRELAPEAILRRDVDELIARYRKAGIRIGRNCYVHGTFMPLGDPIEIGDECVLTYCTILGHDAAAGLFVPELRGSGPFDRISLKRRTVIHDQCFIGVQAIVLCGVEIGPRSLVAAGAVVSQSVPPGVVVAGNPARVIATIEEFVEKHRAALQSNPDDYPGVERS